MSRPRSAAPGGPGPAEKAGLRDTQKKALEPLHGRYNGKNGGVATTLDEVQNAARSDPGTIHAPLLPRGRAPLPGGEGRGGGGLPIRSTQDRGPAPTEGRHCAPGAELGPAWRPIDNRHGTRAPPQPGAVPANTGRRGGPERARGPGGKEAAPPGAADAAAAAKRRGRRPLQGGGGPERMGGRKSGRSCAEGGGRGPTAAPTDAQRRRACAIRRPEYLLSPGACRRGNGAGCPPLRGEGPGPAERLPQQSRRRSITGAPPIERTGSGERPCSRAAGAPPIKAARGRGGWLDADGKEVDLVGFNRLPGDIPRR